MHRLGHWALCAGLPVIFVLYAPFGPLALVMLFLPLYLHYLYLLSYFLLLLPFLQGRCAFASKVAHLRDPELCKLAEGLPLRAAKAKALSTTERYSRAFQKFKEWSACCEEFVCLSSDELSVALLLGVFAAAEFPILRPGVCLLWHKLGTQFVWISKSLRFKTGEERA